MLHLVCPGSNRKLGDNDNAKNGLIFFARWRSQISLSCCRRFCDTRSSGQRSLGKQNDYSRVDYDGYYHDISNRVTCKRAKGVKKRFERPLISENKRDGVNS